VTGSNKEAPVRPTCKMTSLIMDWLCGLAKTSSLVSMLQDFFPLFFFNDAAATWARGFILAKPRFDWRSFSSIMPAIVTQDSHYWTCLGLLGWRDMDRIISICVVSPKVAKASKEGYMKVISCFHVQTLPMYRSLRPFNSDLIFAG